MYLSLLRNKHMSLNYFNTTESLEQHAHALLLLLVSIEHYTHLPNAQKVAGSNHQVFHATVHRRVTAKTLDIVTS